MTEKECTKCKVVKPVSEFYKVHGPKAPKHGLAAWCRNCHRANSSKWQKAHRERCRANNKKWWDKNYKRWYAENKEKVDWQRWRWRLKDQFACSVERYEAMLKEQNGKCAICINECERGRLSVDHCHKTGKIRALLCRKCNNGIADFRESPKIMQSAIAYIQRFQ